MNNEIQNYNTIPIQIRISVPTLNIFEVDLSNHYVNLLKIDVIYIISVQYIIYLYSISLYEPNGYYRSFLWFPQYI